ncbi:MAG: hypothetical protein A2Z86_11635 [Candidatus Glassbacteria bacterium GWA2_58_10]|uniref:Uncharacterized protein n=1 Tax=Candidatus Glassbacteria bacterium GWA2_58_10 TaxID=1817865 RepID=A0A1F5YBS0_9BACT|nr:MAG: hypothetical protein A2Z86_11635 [Candidatus Glassbacteria bacterium GWA2_58_10]
MRDKSRYRSSRVAEYRAPRGIFAGNKTVRFGLIAILACILTVQLYNRLTPHLLKGPIDDVFRHNPKRLAIIYGTGGPAAQELGDYAIKVSHLLGKSLGHPILVYPDTLADNELLENYSLILYGPLEQDLVARTMQEFFPFEFSGRGVALRGRRIEESHWRLIFALPNPLNRKYYVLVYTGPSAADVIGINILGSPNFVRHDTTDYVLAVGDRIVEQGRFDKSDPALWVLPSQ